MSLQEENICYKKNYDWFSRIINGLDNCLSRNIYALDWGHAKDYVEMCWKVLQYKKSDFIIATEKQYSVKFFVEKCFQYLGIKILWVGKGFKERAYKKI